ncbi:hypothetical protein [Pseudoalteromonas sp. MEBiC 03485]|uniref:hypothetical protein n=1 Tax=Pseudoalteromonas sp. MEBiC 03485 TaxID=2571103 RepID=UPI001020CC43|nr:hypothetical protein [Pseudoalteromonas sp. MEBiC 03485]RZD22404.1 hypothetical protein EVU92_10195 [Pseudoalteromonas sp. MEBiC 03485]
MTNILTPILEFIELDAEQNPVVDEQGLPSLIQGPVGLKDIPGLIAKGKIDNLTTFAELQSKHEQYVWAKEYVDYLAERNKVEHYNANLPEPVANEDGSVTEVEPKPLPVAPVRPAVRTVDEVLEPYQKQINKLKGIEYKGVFVSLNESNQNGLSALKSALELATEFGEAEAFFPVNFNAETAQGVQVVTLGNEAEFKQLGLNFIMARKAYFE